MDGDVSQLLAGWAAGDADALGKLIPIVYDELRRLGRSSLRHAPDHSPEPRFVDVLALDEAITRLSAINPRYGRIVELRSLGGLTIDESAAILGISHATVEREWKFARACCDVSWRSTARLIDDSRTASAPTLTTMDWDAVERLFHEALQRPAAERHAFATTLTDPELRSTARSPARAAVQGRTHSRSWNCGPVIAEAGRLEVRNRDVV